MSVIEPEVFELNAKDGNTYRFKPIDDTAGAGNTDKTWSADKLVGEFDDTALSGEIDTPSPIVSFPDGSPYPMGLTASIDPVQDLHGYDHPWPGGGGKNLFPQQNVSGTRWAYVGVTLAPGTYTIGVEATSSDTNANACLILVLFTDDTTQDIAQATRGARYTTTFTVEKTVKQINFYASSNYSLSADDTFQFSNVQVESGSTATAYASYSNICPISGFDGANVTVTGKNLYDPSKVKSVQRNASGLMRAGFVIDKPGTYTTSATEFIGSGAYINIVRVANGVYTDLFSYGPEEKSPYTFTVSDGEYVLAVTNKTGIDAGKECYASAGFQLEVGQTATAYEEPKGKVYPITFPTSAGTVYGGTVTVNPDGTGELVVDRKRIELTSESQIGTVTDSQLGSYASILFTNTLKEDTSKTIASNAKTIPFSERTSTTEHDRVYIDDLNRFILRANSNFTNMTKADFVSRFGNGIFVAPLATPIVYSLSVPQVIALLNLNHVWADTGDINALSYVRNTVPEMIRQDTKGQIASALDPVESSLAIVIDGDVAPTGGLDSGKFVYLRSHSTLARGLYHTTAVIADGASITGNNTEPDDEGVLNEINSHYIAKADGDTDVPNQTVTLLTSITVDSDGLYLVERGCLWAKNTSGIRFISAENSLTPSNTRFKGDTVNAVSDVNFYTSNKMLYYERLHKNDVLYVYGYQSSGTTIKAYPYIFAIKVNNY